MEAILLAVLVLGVLLLSKQGRSLLDKVALILGNVLLISAAGLVVFLIMWLGFIFSNFILQVISIGILGALVYALLKYKKVARLLAD